MARGTLHAGKPADQRRNRNAKPHDEVTLSRDGVLRGPDLEDLTGRTWSPAVQAWYQTWRSSPQAALFEDTDWMRLGMLAHAVDAYHKRPGAALLGEIRMNEERLGATVTDRMRGRMKIEPREDADTPIAPVVSVADRRAEIAARLKE